MHFDYAYSFLHVHRVYTGLRFSEDCKKNFSLHLFFQQWKKFQVLIQIVAELFQYLNLL